MTDRPGYKHTPLGWIPEEWKLKIFGDYATFKNGLNFLSTDEGHKVKIIGVGDFKSLFRVDYASLEQVNLSEKIEESYLVADGDILFVRSNGNKDLIGRVLAIDDVKEDISFSGFTIRARLKDHAKGDPVFFAYLLRSNFIRSQYLRFGGGTNISNLNQDILSQLMIPVPSVKERQRISLILSTWEIAIEKCGKLISELKQRSNGLLQELLHPKDYWKEYRIGDLIKEVRRPVAWDENELYSLISVRRRSGGAFFRESLYGRQILTKQLFNVEAGDFLISKMQIVHGASAIVPKEFDGMKISGSYIAVHAQDQRVLDIDFFNWLSKTTWFYRLTYVSSYGVHIEKMTFDFDDFKRRKILLPPTVKEQMHIAKVLQIAADEVSVQERIMSELQHQKEGLMQKLLLGEVRVKINHE